MKKIAILASTLALGLAQPATAQDTAPDLSGMAAAMADKFKAEPLAPEQQARVPQAQQVVAQVFPAGTYRKMMDQMMGPMMDAMMGSFQQMPLADLARLGGIEETELAALGETTLGEMTAIIDPAFEERNQVIAQVSIDMATGMMDRIEPSYRAGLARAYAVRFSSDELAELQRMFSTPVGARYASESMLIYADPQVMAAMNELMPAMLEMMPQMVADMQAKTAHLPPVRGIGDLTEAELERLSTMLGVPVSDLAQRASEARDVTDQSGDDQSF